MGCEVINPPVFLSEDEARQVIQEEAKRAGITFAADGGQIEGVKVPVTDSQAFLQELKTDDSRAVSRRGPRTKVQDLAIDGRDAKRKIGYEFVSEADFKAWEEPSGASTLYDYDVRQAATALREGLAERKAEGVYAVFYDPAIGYQDAEQQMKNPLAAGEARWKAIPAQAKIMASGELRKQVRDFIAWLKAQGVI